MKLDGLIGMKIKGGTGADVFPATPGNFKREPCYDTSPGSGGRE
jgi:hypothetical protein